jgi:very-short-patch-repair endonuclease
MNPTALASPTIPRAATLLAQRQHGLVGVAQLHDLGLSYSAIRNQREQGDWDPVTHRVLRRAGAPPTDAQQLMAVLLDVGPHQACIGYRAGAYWWGVPGFSLHPIDVMVLRGGRQAPTSLGVVHRPRHLPDPYATVLDGIKVVRPSLLVLQLAPRVHPERLKRIVDHLWSARLVSGPSLRADLGPLLKRGRPGSAAVRELLDGLPDDYVPTASALEGRTAAILDAAGLGPYRRQVDSGDEVRWCGRVDLRHATLPVVVEIDSERYHSALTDVAADDARAERLEHAGFEVVRVTDTEVWHRPGDVVARVRASERRARARRRR